MRFESGPEIVNVPEGFEGLLRFLVYARVHMTKYRLFPRVCADPNPQ